MKLLHSNLWWSEGVELLKKCFTYLKRLDLYRKMIRNIDDIWDSGRKVFVIWEEAQEILNFLPADEIRWSELTDKVAEASRDMLENDLNTIFSRFWVGLYGEGREDPIIVIQCTPEFTPPCLQHYNMSLPIPAHCFMVGHTFLVP